MVIFIEMLNVTNIMEEQDEKEVSRIVTEKLLEIIIMLEKQQLQS